MLSFQKDEQSQLSAGHAEQTAGQPDQANTISQEKDYLTVSSHGKKLRQSTFILAVLFAVGALGLWFMVKKTVPLAANAAPSQDQAQIDAALAQINTMQAEMDNQMDSVVGKFYEFGNVEQVQVDELKKNPFKREFGQLEEAKVEDELQQLRDKAVSLAQKMDLWSITENTRGKCCMINNKLLYEGDVITEMTVKQINKKSVILEYSGIPVELKMSE